MIKIDQQIVRALLASLFDPGLPLVIPPEGTDRLVLALARHHRLSPALSVLPASNFSTALVEQFRQDRLVTLGRTTLLRRDLIEVVKALDAAGVRTVVLKGLAYEELLYPDRGTRPATDIDLLVRRYERPAAFRVFRALGYVPERGGPGFDEPDYHEVTLHRGETFVDLHFGLAPFVRGLIDYDALWAATTKLPIDSAPSYSLSRTHAALNQALHMAIHHFDVPGIYLLDLARLAAEQEVADHAARIARAWRCLRSWNTSTALTADFIPAAHRWLMPMESAATPRIGRIIRSFGTVAALPRPEQLRRKVQHFDTRMDAIRYLAVQSRRALREQIMSARGVGSAAERLGWSQDNTPGGIGRGRTAKPRISAR